MASAPTDFGGLFAFYYEYVKPLYSSVQFTNHLPVEVLFEINAAFDHISRHWKYGESQETSIEKAYSHLKRSCLDIFKLKAKDATDEYNELKRIDVSVIDNGDFERQMIDLYEEIRIGAINARSGEGQAGQETDLGVPAFDLWAPVYAKCVEFHDRFYTHKKIEWARKKHQVRTFRQRALDVLIGFGVGVVASLVAAFVYALMTAPTP
jgi:hypothetical protein